MVEQSKVLINFVLLFLLHKKSKTIFGILYADIYTRNLRELKKLLFLAWKVVIDSINIIFEVLFLLNRLLFLLDYSLRNIRRKIILNKN